VTKRRHLRERLLEFRREADDGRLSLSFSFFFLSFFLPFFSLSFASHRSRSARGFNLISRQVPAANTPLTCAICPRPELISARATSAAPIPGRRQAAALAATFIVLIIGDDYPRARLPILRCLESRDNKSAARATLMRNSNREPQRRFEIPDCETSRV